MRVLTSLVLALCVLTSPVRAFAQPAAVNPDEQAVQSYRLTMPKLKQLNQVYAAMAKAAQADPRMQMLKTLQDELDTLEKKDEPTDAEMTRMEELRGKIEELEDGDDSLDMDDAKTIAEMVRKIDAQPQMAAAVRSSGLSTREFATMQLAFMQAMFAYGFLKSGTIKELPKEVNADNVKFLQDHEAEIQAMTKSWQQEAGRK